MHFLLLKGIREPASFLYLCAGTMLTARTSRNITKSNPPSPSLFLSRVPEAVIAKPIVPHNRESALAASLPVKFPNFAVAPRMPGHEEEPPTNANINRQPFAPPRTRSGRKYPIASIFALVFVFLMRWLSIAMAPDIKKPPKRATMTLSNRITLVEVGMSVGLFAFWSHLVCR